MLKYFFLVLCVDMKHVDKKKKMKSYKKIIYFNSYNEMKHLKK